MSKPLFGICLFEILTTQFSLSVISFGNCAISRFSNLLLRVMRVLVFEFYGYLTYRCDRVGGGGGGSLIHARDSLLITCLLADGPWRGFFEAVGIRVSSSIGPLNILAVYSPPNAQVGFDVWCALIDSVGGRNSLPSCGDINSHSPLWGSRFSNFRGRELCSVILDRGFVSLNDSLPTPLPIPGRSAGNLDMVFYPA